VIIDTDPATGVRFRDVDDGLAILFLLASPGISLEGVTINFGNVPSHTGLRVAGEVLDAVRGAPGFSGDCIPVFEGASSKQKLGRENPAVEFLINTVNENPGEITLLAVAPLTNVATAMMLDNDFAKNLRELVIMGGTFSFKPFSFFGEFNFHLDGKAASFVTAYPVKKTILTMDVCSQSVFKKEHLLKFKKNSGNVSKYLAENIEPWLNLNRMIFFRKGGFFPWDVVAAAYVTDRTLFDEKPFFLSIREEGLRSGSVYNISERSGFESEAGIVPVNIPQKLDGGRFMDLFVQRLLTL